MIAYFFVLMPQRGVCGVTKPASIAKITRPVLTGIVRRKRLFQDLGKSRDGLVIWVTGPPGCGKTTLIASYLDFSKIPSLWYKVDEGDADIATFFYYMGLAAKKAAPHKRRPLPLLTPEYLLGIPTFTLRFFEEMYSRLKPPFAIVFDNYQQVPLESKFHDVIKDGLSAIPEKINVILISRGSLPRQLVRFQANNKISLLGWNEIRFSLNETREVVQMRRRKDLTDEIVLQLHKKTDGWAAGLILMLEMAEIKSIDYQFMHKFIPEEIFGYFANEIFDKTDRETQDFLVKTAFLPQITPHMAQELTDNPLAKRILFDLNQKNYFTQKYVLQKESYQYHPLFREFLLTRAKDSFEPSILTGIRKKAAALLEADWQIEDAIALLHEAGDWQDMIRLILQQAPSMIAQGRNMTVVQWLHSLPEDLIEKNPWLLYWMGICLMPFSPKECKRYLDKAFELFQAGKDAAGLFLSLTGMFEAVIFRFDRFDVFDQLIPMLYGVLNEFKEFPSEEIEASSVEAFLSAMSMRRPDIPDIEQWIRRGLALAERILDCNTALRILVSITMYYTGSGELERAASTLDLTRRVVKAGHVNPLSTILLKETEALYYWLAGEFEKSRKAAEEGFALADASGVHILDFTLVVYSTAEALSVGDIKRAEYFLQRMSSSLDQIASPFVSLFYHLLSTWKALLTKDLAHANMHSDLSLKFALESGSPFNDIYSYPARAIVMHELQREEDALKYITQARDICSTLNLHQAEFRCLLAEAQFAFDRGDEEAGKEILRKAMKLGREHGYRNTAFWLPSVMTRLCLKALEADIEVEYVQNLIRKRNLIPDFPPYECENWPWPMKIFTLGRFGLLKEGNAVKSSKKGQQKPLSMLKALIALGGRDIKEEQLTDLLWPDAEGDAAYNAFTTTLSRLRKLLGIEEAIKCKEGRITLDSRYCWVDSWVFERLVGKIEELWEQGQSKPSTEEVIRLTEKAITMYRGHFLSADDEHWALSCRERLRSKFLRLVTKLGECLERTGQCEKAVEYYQRALEVDNLAEEFYQHLMVCYQHLGQQAEAMRVYKRCRNVLSTVFGIEPSSRTETIYKSLNL
jgi:LuxR family maltose regulon positive regulatory protein